MKKILVTGAGGYIGSVSTHLLLEKGYEVIGVDNLDNGYEQPLKTLQEKHGKGKFRYHIANIEDAIEDVFKEESEIDGVIHYAAPCSVNESMQDPGKYFNTVNIGRNLLESMLRHDVKNIVFSSTCAVYGEAEYVPIDEKHPTNPSNPYGESKLMVEKMLRWYGDIQDLHYVVLRYFNVCGASDDSLVGDSKKPSVHLVQNAVRGAMGLEKFFLTCPTVDTPDKTPVRDYVNVVDLNVAHVKALEYLFSGGKNETINLGTGDGNSVLEIVNTVEKITGKSIEKDKTTPREGEYATMIASIKKAQDILGWSPQRSLKDSVHSLVKWYTDHPHGWDK